MRVSMSLRRSLNDAPCGQQQLSIRGEDRERQGLADLDPILFREGKAVPYPPVSVTTGGSLGRCTKRGAGLTSADFRRRPIIDTSSEWRRFRGKRGFLRETSCSRGSVSSVSQRSAHEWCRALGGRTPVRRQVGRVEP